MIYLSNYCLLYKHISLKNKNGKQQFVTSNKFNDLVLRVNILSTKIKELENLRIGSKKVYFFYES